MIKYFLFALWIMFWIGMPFLPESFILSIFVQSVPEWFYPILFMPIIFLFHGLLIKFVLFAIIAIPGFVFFFTPSIQETPEFYDFSIASWNTRLWDQRKEDSLFNQDLMLVSRYPHDKRKFDILLLQEHEYSLDDHVLIPAHDSDRLERCCGYHNIFENGRLVIASVFDGDVIETESDRLQFVVLDIDGRKVGIINLHNHVHLSRSVGFFIRNFFSFISQSQESRYDLYKELRDILREYDNIPIVVGGDFNATIFMPEYRKTVLSYLDKSYMDVFPGSFPSIFPLVRIDQILTNGRTQRQCGIRPEKTLSDHRSVYCFMDFTD